MYRSVDVYHIQWSFSSKRGLPRPRQHALCITQATICKLYAFYMLKRSLRSRVIHPTVRCILKHFTTELWRTMKKLIHFYVLQRANVGVQYLTGVKAQAFCITKHCLIVFAFSVLTFLSSFFMCCLHYLNYLYSCIVLMKLWVIGKTTIKLINAITGGKDYSLFICTVMLNHDNLPKVCANCGMKWKWEFKRLEN